MRQNIFFLLTTLFALTAYADDENVSATTRVLHTIPLENGTVAYVVVREGGHMVGQPFNLELRANCSSEKKDVKELEPVDAHSVCDLDPKSVVINKDKTAVAVKTKMADKDYYDKQVESGATEIKTRCSRKTKIVKFSLRTLCQN